MQKEVRKPTMQEISHITATCSLRPSPSQIITPLLRIDAVQLAQRAASPHADGNGRGLHTSISTADGKSTPCIVMS